MAVFRRKGFAATSMQDLGDGMGIGRGSRVSLMFHNCVEWAVTHYALLRLGVSAVFGFLFLRDTEHAIQGYADKQTQDLPTDDLQRLALAVAMGQP